MARLLSSFWWFFRPIFVLFFLYLMGDAFFRWDGFSYYGTFAEFVPGVALASVLWCILAFFTALLATVTSATLRRLTAWKITIQHFLLFTILFILSGIIAWYVKRNILHLGITIQITLIEFACALTIAVLATWLLRVKAGLCIDIIQSRITPLVWLYGILVILSVPVVAYHTWGNDSDTIQPKIPAPSYTTTENRPNIILVTFDALSVKNMSVYGYRRPTTPFISEWAKKASVFTRLEASGTFTALASASLMTGKRAWSHKVFQLHSINTLKSDIESLPLLLKKNGYYNMSFSANRFASAKSIGVLNGFDYAPPFYEFWSGISLHGNLESILARFFDGKIRLYEWVIQGDFITAEFLVLTNRYRNVRITDYPPEKVFDGFLRHINENHQEPFFAWLHLYPPHAPYLPPRPYMGMINSSPKLRESLEQNNVYFNVDSYKSGSVPLDEVQPQIDMLRDRYDEFIMYCDNQFENFIQRLDAMNSSGKTIVILSADHGEVFTPSDMGHGGRPREAVTNIPLIIREAGQTKQKIIDDLIEQIDIPATILDMAYIQAPQWMEGRSLVPLINGKLLPQQPAFAGDFQRNPSRGEMISEGIIAVWDGDYKLVYDLDKKTSNLFNIITDPDEQNNIAVEEPAVGQRLLGLIMDKINKANQQSK